jgi:hypothetical protein
MMNYVPDVCILMSEVRGIHIIMSEDVRLISNANDELIGDVLDICIRETLVKESTS